MKFSLLSNSVEQTHKFGEALGRTVQEGDIIALCGELGAGKTELVRGIARGMECEKNIPVTSPTYILLREYPGRLWLYHFDFYRLDSPVQLEGIGYEEYFEGDGVCVVEWADKFPQIFPEQTLWIELEIVSENTRKLVFQTKMDKIWKGRLEKIFPEGK